MNRLRALLASVLLCAGSFTGAAAEPPGSILSEVKFGLLEHDVGFLGTAKEPGRDINAELLFVSPDFLSFAFSPRPHLGFSVNTAGATSLAYAGLTWIYYPFETGALGHLWISPFGGGTVHNGKLHSHDPKRKSNGSRVLFHFGAEIGVDLTDQMNISAYYEHSSNAWLADKNEGINSAGIRIGWRF